MVNIFSALNFFFRSYFDKWLCFWLIIAYVVQDALNSWFTLACSHIIQQFYLFFVEHNFTCFLLGIFDVKRHREKRQTKSSGKNFAWRYHCCVELPVLDGLVVYDRLRQRNLCIGHESLPYDAVNMDSGRYCFPLFWLLRTGKSIARFVFGENQRKKRRQYVSRCTWYH